MKNATETRNQADNAENTVQRDVDDIDKDKGESDNSSKNKKDNTDSIEDNTGSIENNKAPDARNSNINKNTEIEKYKNEKKIEANTDETQTSDTGKKRKLRDDELIADDTTTDIQLRKQPKYPGPNPINNDQDEDNNSSSSDTIPEDDEDDALDSKNDVKEDNDNADLKTNDNDAKSDNDVNKDNAENEEDNDSPDLNNIDNDAKSDNDVNEDDVENKNDDEINVQIDPKKLFKDVLYLQKENDKIPEEYLEDLKETYLDCLNNKEEKSKHVYFPMECLIDQKIDRPELVKLSRKHISYEDKDIQADETHAFHMQYVPFTHHYKGSSRLVSCLRQRFDENEEEVMKSVLDDENTQALSLGFCDDNFETGMQDFSIISTIIFRIVCGNHVKDQFIFIYYRATDDRPLAERQSNKAGFFAEYKKKMDNHGFGRFLIILSQQLLKKFSNDKKEEKIYLLAKPRIADDFYTKGLGFSQLGSIEKADKNQLYKNASKELKECLDIEMAEDAKLILLLRNKSIVADKVNFGRKVSNTLELTIKKLDMSHYSHHEPLMMSLMKKDYSTRLEKISDDEVESYVERQSSNTNDSNPFEFMLPDIHEHSRLHISDIIKQLDLQYDTSQVLKDDNLTEGLFDDEVSTDTENEEDEVKALQKDKSNKMELSSVDRQFMGMFAFEVKFDGTIGKKNEIKCKYGNIYCNHCKKQIIEENIPVKKLIKWCSNIMQQHLIGNTQYLGFVTSNSRAKFEDTFDLDKSKIIKCSGTKDRTLIVKLFEAISTDSGMKKEEAEKKAKCAIVFINNLITHFYGEGSSLFIQYIRRGCRKFDYAMEEIRKNAVRENRRKHKNKDKELEAFLLLYRNMYYDRGSGLTFAQREKLLIDAITTNPPKKAVTEKKNRPIMFHGVDLSIFPTVKERQIARKKIREEEVKKIGIQLKG